jgi:NodT family efflux transporter outer membrane factor (OMF) lipoprotein
MRSTLRCCALIASALGLGACAVGPDYRRAPVETVAAYKEQGDWKPSEPEDVLKHGEWWRIFNDPVLDGLERQIDVSNQTLKAAQDTYRQASALVDQARAGLWPTIGASAARERGVPAPGAPAATTNSLTGTASWELDLWGQVRRTVESDLASAQASEAAVAAARLLAQATLAIDYFDLRAQDSLEAIFADTVIAEQRSLQITQSRYSFGVAAKADVVTAQTQLLTSQAQQVNAAIARAQYEHAIAVLTGKQPATFSIPAMPLGSEVPTTPTGLPSTLLERRPDVAQAERRMAAANAQIGVAKAAFFPTLTLSASGGYSNTGPLSQLISAPSRVWGLGPTLAETLFEGGARRAALAQARAAYDVTLDDYRQTVLAGFQQVEDNLVALRVLEKQAGIETDTVAAAREAERLTLNQYRAGTVPYTSVITAQTTTLSSEQTELTVLLDRLTASVSLIEALGGGWSAAQLR